MFSLASSFMFSLASSLAFSPGTFGVRPYVNNQPVNQISPVSVTARERAQVIFTFGLALFCRFAALFHNLFENDVLIKSCWLLFKNIVDAASNPS